VLSVTLTELLSKEIYFVHGGLMRLFSALFVILHALVLYAVDYDCVFVGSSPIPLLEALYQSRIGKKVLILEQASECGGAWKSIDICGIPHVDMGCHDLTWSDAVLTDFFENYLGCKVVSLAQPKGLRPATGPFWFARGCYELMHNLLQMIAHSSIELRLNRRLDSISFDPCRDCVLLHVQGETLTTKKLFTTSLSSFSWNTQRLLAPVKYYHLYLLIQDPTPTRFTSGHLGGGRASRIMNLTHSAELSDTGKQLIVIQTHSEQEFTQGQKFLDLLKMLQMVDSSAYLLRAEPYIYEATYGNWFSSLNAQQRSYIEMLNTCSLAAISSFLARWKTVFMVRNK
jgi:hypothetical protein